MNSNTLEHGPFVTLHGPSGMIDGSTRLMQAAVRLWAREGLEEELPVLAYPPSPGIATNEAIWEWAAETATTLSEFAGHLPGGAMEHKADSVRDEVHLQRVHHRNPDNWWYSVRGDVCPEICVLKIVMSQARIIIHWDTGLGVQIPFRLPIALELGPLYQDIVSWSDSSNLGTHTTIVRIPDADYRLSDLDEEKGQRWELSGTYSEINWLCQVGGIVELGDCLVAVTVPNILREALLHVAEENGWEVVDTVWSTQPLMR